MKRIQSADLMRLLAVLAVIGIHTSPFEFAGWASASAYNLPIVVNQLARFAVPMFFVLSGYFWGMKIAALQTGAGSVSALRVAATSAAAKSIASLSTTSIWRVLRIWLFWSVVYLIPFNVFAPEPYDVWGRVKILHFYYWQHLQQPIDLLFTGTSGHLWFLISLACCMAISAALVQRGRHRLLWVLALGFYGVAVLGKAYAGSSYGFSIGFDLRNGPFFGLLFFVTGYQLSRRAWLGMGATRPLGLALLTFTIGAGLHLAEVNALHQTVGASFFQDFVFSTWLFGLGAAAIALSDAPWLRIPRGQQLGALVLGIYVAQGVFIELLNPAKPLIAQYLGGAGFSLVVFGVTGAFVGLASRVRHLRPYVM